MLTKALEELEKKNSRPKEKVHQYVTESRSTLQQMLNSPYIPPIMVYEKPNETSQQIYKPLVSKKNCDGDSSLSLATKMID